MKLIDRLYTLHKMYPAGSDRVGIVALVEVWEALPKLLEVVEAATELVETSVTQSDILEDGTIIPTKCSVDPELFEVLQGALTALEEEV